MQELNIQDSASLPGALFPNAMSCLSVSWTLIWMLIYRSVWDLSTQKNAPVENRVFLQLCITGIVSQMLLSWGEFSGHSRRFTECQLYFLYINSTLTSVQWCSKCPETLLTVPWRQNHLIEAPWLLGTLSPQTLISIGWLRLTFHSLLHLSVTESFSAWPLLDVSDHSMSQLEPQQNKDAASQN